MLDRPRPPPRSRPPPGRQEGRARVRVGKRIVPVELDAETLALLVRSELTRPRATPPIAAQSAKQ
jgi:hypothetical protein